MTSPAANQIISRVEATFANGVPWTSPSNVSATAWERSEEGSGPEVETVPLGGARDSRRWGVPLNANVWRSL